MLLRLGLIDLVVVFAAEVGDGFFAHHPAQGVLELGQLDEHFVLGIEPGGGLRALVVEAQPFLDTAEPGALPSVST